MNVIHIHEEYPEHDWVRNEDGSIDTFAMAYDYHNGPECKRCYHSFCEHCNPDGYTDTPCIVDYYKCPICGKKLNIHQKFCDECGTKLDWED